MGYKATINKINCTFTAQDEEGYNMSTSNFSEGTYSMEISCANGYSFVSTPVLTYIDESGYEETANFNKVSDIKYTLTLYLDSDIIVDAVAKVNKTYYSINVPDNVSVTLTDTNGFIIANDSIEEGTTYTVTVTPDTGYTVRSGNCVFLDEEGYTSTVYLSNNIATVKPYSNITLSVTLDKETRPIWKINDKLTNAIYEPTTIYRDETTIVSVIANDNYYWNELPKVNYYDAEGYKVYLTGVKVSDVRVDFTISSDIGTSDNILDIEGEAVQSTPITEKYGIIKVFNPTSEELKAISKKRFIVDYGIPTILDLGMYISKLFKLYCNVDSSSTGEINLGSYDIGVTSKVVSNYEVTVDCGRVFVEGFYANALDYTDTIIDMFIPFIGTERLDTEKVMGEYIRLIYKVNVLNGDCVAIITNGYGDTIYRFEGNMSFTIPYKTNDKDYNEAYGYKSDDKSLLGFTPILYIRSKVALECEGTIQDNYKRDVISNFNGYHEFTDFDVDNMYIVEKEREEIKQLLESGVII